MRIAVDFQSTQGQPTGIGVFAAALNSAILNEDPSIEFVYFTRKSDRNPGTLGRIAWESLEIPAKVRQCRPDLFYSPGFAPPIACRARRVVTVHDLIGLAYPQNHRSFSYLYWSGWLPATLKRAHRLVASSESTRRDIRRFLGIPEERVSVVPLFCDGRFRKINERNKLDEICIKYNLLKPFLIGVSTLEPRKNFLKLLQAYEMLKKKGKADFSVLIAGKDGGAGPELHAFIKEKSLENRVKIAGYVPENDLVALYNAAAGYVNVSFYEGFGLPVLEAMSCGLSGVVSNRSSLPEVSGDTAICVDPENVAEIADGMDNFMHQSPLRESLSLAAHERSRKFSGQRAAREMISIFKKEAL